LFHDWYPIERIEREYSLTRSLHSAGLPVPATHQLLRVEDRTGIVYERITGISMLAFVERKPWKLPYAARHFAELHASLHQHTAPPEFPSQRDQLQTWLAAARDFSPPERLAAERSLAALPDGDTLCHGDFHPDNILLTPSGPAILDWTDATRGHPYADVARTSVMFQTADLPSQTSLLIRILFRFSRRLLHRTYLRHYLRLRGGTENEILQWLPIQRAAVSAWRCDRTNF
jgi:aminoglycoside phosphotransferase (APT) family kinase protein